MKRALARIALLSLGVAIPPLLLAQTEPVRRPSKYQALNTDKGRLLINNPAPLKLSVAGRLAFTVIDARPEVMSGERKPEFAGLSRSLYGIPSPNNGYRPVATFFGIALTDALAKGGVDHDSMVSRPYEGRDKALPALKSFGADRLVILEIHDWWTDHLVKTDLHHDLGLVVLDLEGRELGSSRSKGSDTLGRGRPDRRDLDTAFNSILASLFSAPSIVQALSDKAAPVAASTARCTVDQILKMKESGLGEDQIRAACGEVGW